MKTDIKESISALRDYHSPTGFTEASRAPPWELISRTYRLEKPSGSADLANTSTTIRSHHKYDRVLSAPALPLRWEQDPAAAALGAGSEGPRPWLATPSSPRLPSQSHCKGLQENTKSFSDVVWKREPSIAWGKLSWKGAILHFFFPFKG